MRSDKTKLTKLIDFSFRGDHSVQQSILVVLELLNDGIIGQKTLRAGD